MDFRKKVQSGKFVYTLELSIPKGTDLTKLYEKVDFLKEHFDVVNIPDNPRAIMKVGALSVCHKLGCLSVETILHLTCKDRNKIALQSDLLSAHVLGIKNVLAITGDRAVNGDHPDAIDVFEFDSTGLLKIISTLNSGKDLSGNELEGKPDFFAGATLTPVDSDSNLKSVEEKIKSGAQFFQTQMVYDSSAFLDYIEKVKHLKPKIIAGIMPLKSIKMAEFINTRIPGVNVPRDVIDELKKTRESRKFGIEFARRTIDEIRNSCAGIHLMPLGNEEVIEEIL